MNPGFLAKAQALSVPGCGLVALSGGLDVEEGLALEDLVRNAAKLGWTKVIVLDCAKLEYLDAGAASLVSAVAEMERTGGDIVLINVSEPIKEVLATLEFNVAICVLPTLAEALAFCSAA